MTRSYQEILGSLGRAVTDRPRGHLIREFLAEHAADLFLLAPLEGEEVSHSLYDISMNGASFIVEPGGRREHPSWSVLAVAIRVRGERVQRSIHLYTQHSPRARHLRSTVRVVHPVIRGAALGARCSTYCEQETT